ncbi:MAG: sigma-70 family RNA polymerase sigma factor [Hyphomicrobiaceae bacterium]
MTIDFASVLAQCASGNKQALKSLFEAEAGRMLGVAQRIVRRRDLAEEVVQDAFVQIWQKAATFDASLGSGRAWIYTIVRHRALNVIRDGAREDLADADALDAFRESEGAADDPIERLDRDSRLRACLEALPTEKRECVVLSYVAGYSHGEIAGRLGVPVGTAKSWVRRGLNLLKECMA